MACNDCDNSNPITPVYSNAKYVLNPNCVSVCPPEIYVPPGGLAGKSTELIAGTDILVEDFSDATLDKFRVSYNPFLALTASLSLQGVVGGIVQALPILKGKTVDETRATWTYNKGTIASQTLDEGGGPVSVPAIDRAKTTTGLTITSDITYTLEGDDGYGEAGSIANDTASLTFGNYLITGDYTDMVGQNASAVSALIAGLASKNTVIKTSRAASVYATGLAGRHFFIIYPAAWGLGTFTKGIFEGGFVRLKNEAGVLVTTVTGVELPISWTNEAGHTEDFYVYQSLYDNAEDLVDPIIIS